MAYLLYDYTTNKRRKFLRKFKRIILTILKLILIAVIVAVLYIVCIKGVQIGDKIYWLRPSASPQIIDYPELPEEI